MSLGMSASSILTALNPTGAVLCRIRTVLRGVGIRHLDGGVMDTELSMAGPPDEFSHT